MQFSWLQSYLRTHANSTCNSVPCQVVQANAQQSQSPNVQEDDHFHVEDNCKDELLNDVTKKLRIILIQYLRFLHPVLGFSSNFFLDTLIMNMINR